ncbi:acetyltransferase [Alicyclobacillus acidoterrestris]|uniref:GNAT family N-acetyltransferase n=1 Tax=Alicyclobacillus suci TaxID=2816080 RepID=UPI0011973595|nr:GNAT family N-acetyltransferase [Alicyclobacillus suci]GEO27143.1 acetyltransferase [Alicyclobacillus acidoterrestris]
MLETSRLFFRPYQMKDFQFYLSLWQDPEIIRFIGSGKVRSKTALKLNYPYWLSKSELGKGVLVTVFKATQQPVGHAGLVPQEIDGKLQMELGYWVSRRYWGLGIGTEAARFFRDLAFRELGLNRLVSLIQPENTRSIHVAQKIGMQFADKTTFRGTPVNLYAIDKTDYETLHKY